MSYNYENDSSIWFHSPGHASFVPLFFSKVDLSSLHRSGTHTSSVSRIYSAALALKNLGVFETSQKRSFYAVFMRSKMNRLML